MVHYIGNTSSKALSIAFDGDQPVTVKLNAQTHTKPVDFHCETYTDQAYVGTTTFTSVYTATPPDNTVTFEAGPNFDVIACSAQGIDIDAFMDPMPAGKTLSYTFYKDYATSQTETEAAKAGGIVMKFKPDQKISPNDGFELQLLAPFSEFSSKPDAKCVIDPPVSDFAPILTDRVFLGFTGSFEANQKYVVTCPYSKVVLPYTGGTYNVATAIYYSEQSDKYYQSDIKKIEFANAASFVTVLGSVVLAASAFVVLF